MTRFAMHLWVPTVCGILLLSGCAMQQDLSRVQSGLDRKIETMRGENESLNASNKEALEAVRKSQAEINADMAELKDRIQQLTGKSDEQKKDLASLATRANRKDEELKDIREKLDAASFKVNFIENFLGLSKKGGAAETPAKPAVKNGNGPKKELKTATTEKEAMYAAAYETYKQGQYEKARTEFQNFLKQHPKTEYSGSAQFWIGECYYLEQQYEKAILEYEKVIKNYPEGNKVSKALLKQGLAFQHLGDKTSAKLILQQVIRDYPNTNDAKAARSKLLEIR
jgi:tol-pal system protein YbgF